MDADLAIIDAVQDCLVRLDVRNRHVSVGLSGGRDSVVLLDAMGRLRESMPFRLSAIHVHHGLSPNADGWAAFCDEYCAAMGVALTQVRVALDRSAPGGLEATARAARYQAFCSSGADFLAAAQHADDQAETVLHQLLRGTGWKGLAGMGPQRVLHQGLVLIRPLLGLTRNTIQEYAQVRKLQWIEDESNEDCRHTRNFIRHQVLPPVAARFPHYRESLARLGRHAADADAMLAELAMIDLQWDGVHASAAALDSLPLRRQVNALYHWLQWQQRAGVTFPSQAQLGEWAGQLFRQKPADRTHQAGGHDFIIERRNNRLELTRK